MIEATALVDKFKFALENKWGYIFGQSGTMWTNSDQKLKVNYMVKNYGEDWKKNADAKNNKYYLTAMYGSKWIGHNVADCSGMFVWVYRKYGLSISHRSTAIYTTYCNKKGKLNSDLKKTLIPGTAVFTGDTATDHPHVGLYVGDGKCIEASGVDAGVIRSNITDGKWKWYGLLKDVKYPASEATEQPSAPTDEEIPVQTLPTLRKGNTGEYVTLLQTKLLQKGYDLGKYGVDGDFGSATLAAVKAFQRDHGLTVDGVVGRNTWTALNDSTTTVQLYTVTIPNLTERDADALVKAYKGAYKEKEVG